MFKRMVAEFAVSSSASAAAGCKFVISNASTQRQADAYILSLYACIRVSGASLNGMGFRIVATTRSTHMYRVDRAAMQAGLQQSQPPGSQGANATMRELTPRAGPTG